jgi:hypothetical protein
MKVFWTSAALALASAAAATASRREDVIDDWIRKIREAPKGHSMSPSWSTKSRIPVIGVGELPLQVGQMNLGFGRNFLRTNFFRRELRIFKIHFIQLFIRLFIHFFRQNLYLAIQDKIL